VRRAKKKIAAGQQGDAESKNAAKTRRQSSYQLVLWQLPSFRRVKRKIIASQRGSGETKKQQRSVGAWNIASVFVAASGRTAVALEAVGRSNLFSGAATWSAF